MIDRLIKPSTIQHRPPILGRANSRQLKMHFEACNSSCGEYSRPSPDPRECGGSLEAEMSVNHQPNPHYTSPMLR